MPEHEEYVDESTVRAGPGIVVEEIEAGTIRVSLAPGVLDALTRLPAILSALDAGPADSAGDFAAGSRLYGAPDA